MNEKKTSTLTEQQRYILVQQGLDKLDKILQETAIAKDNEIWDTLASRIYFAVFRAVSTLLIDNGIQIKTHKGIVAQFGKYFVLPNIFSKEDGQLISHLQILRESADYEGTFYTTRDKIIPLYDKALNLITRIQERLIDSQKLREENVPSLKELSKTPHGQKP